MSHFGMTHFRRALLALACCCLTAALGPAARGQTPERWPAATITAAWENVTRAPGWTELQITLNNEEGRWQGALQVEDEAQQITYRLPLDLPAPASKYYRLPLFIASTTEPRLSLINAAGAERPLPLQLRKIVPEERACGIADPLAALTLGKSQGCAVTVLLQSAQSLPETAMAWDSLDVFVINGLNTAELTAAQQEALLAWVSLGGRLVVGGGATLPQALAGLPAQLLAATPLAAGDAGFILKPAADAAILYREGQTARAVEAAVGLGYVDIVGWDLSHADRSAWLATLWADDGSPALQTPVGVMPAAITPAAYSLLEMPAQALSQLLTPFAALPLYILLIGPLTLFIVRRRKQPMLAWVLLPAWIALGVFGLGFWLNGTFAQTFPLVHEVAFTFAPGPGLPARTIQSMAVLAPRARTLAWENAPAPRPMLGGYDFRGNTYSEGLPFPITVNWNGVGAQMSTLRPFGPITWGSEGLSVAPDITLETTLTSGATSPRLEGVLQSTIPLKDIYFILNGGEYAMALADNIPANTPLQVSEPISAAQDLSMMYIPLCSMLGYNPGMYPYAAPYKPGPSMPPTASANPVPRCYLVGVTDAVPFPVKALDGTQAAESCLFIAVPCPRAPTGKGQVQALARTNSIENGWADQNSLYVSLPRTTVIYQLPGFIQMQHIEAVSITLINPASWDKPLSAPEAEYLEKIELWDWTAERWLAAPAPYTGLALTYSDAEAQRRFDPVNGLRLRLTPKPEFTPLNVEVLVTVTGEW